MDIDELVQKHDNDLYRGNGKPGITTRMAICEERIDGVKEILDKMAANQMKMLWLVVGTLLTVVGDIFVRAVIK